MLELTDVLAALVEQYSSGAGAGGRGVLGLRPALQQLCKAALDGLHRRSLGKLTSEWHSGVGWAVLAGRHVLRLALRRRRAAVLCLR